MVEPTTEDELMALGGNIELAGFKDMDKPSMIIVKKMIGNYAKRILEKYPNFERVKVTLKTIHEIGDSKKFDLHGKVLIGGHPYNAEVVERNLFMGIDTVLTKIEHELRL